MFHFYYENFTHTESTELQFRVRNLVPTKGKHELGYNHKPHATFSKSTSPCLFTILADLISQSCFLQRQIRHLFLKLCMFCVQNEN